MTDLPRDIERARRLLGAVTPAPSARERIYASIVAPRPRTRHKLLSPALITAAVLVASGAAAVSLGIVELPRSFLTPQSVPEAAPSATRTPRRTVGRAGLHRSDPQPATPTVSSGDPIPPTAAFSDRQQTALHARRAPATAGVEPKSSHGSDAPAAESELARQVKAYRRAVSLIPDQPSRALGELRAFRGQWPASALGHEVDLRIVQTLLTLGNSADARREAQAFLARYPGSPRAAEMRSIVENANRADDGSR